MLQSYVVVLSALLVNKEV
ncbi:hypothetical protein E2C01_056806 [Portunus trituberculatus]|uniref:Uncharacterized protein n=1 Tax=Portunus trituberculatus TaxID=210409 RepID=A0A5B7H055_PORTR|nr:hypothetical protein [Portunus trituberculatus]